MYENLKGKKLTLEDKKCFASWIINRRTLEEIERTVNLKVFEEYPELLTPSIFSNKAKEIEEVYNIYCLYKLESYISSSYLCLKKEEVQAKINFLQDNNYSITTETNSGKIKINSIMLMSNEKLKLQYGISKKELLQKYKYIDSDNDLKNLSYKKR